MNEMIHIGAGSYPLAKLDDRAYYALMEADALPFDGRAELIEGVLVEMSPSKSPHGNVLFSLSAALQPMLPRHLKGGVDIAIGFDTDLVLAPDIAFYPRAILGEHVPGEKMALVVEVAVSSLSHDLKTKAQYYARQKVAHYWVIDIDNRATFVHLGPLHSGYDAIEKISWDDPIVPPFAPDHQLVLSKVLQT